MKNANAFGCPIFFSFIIPRISFKLSLEGGRRIMIKARGSARSTVLLQLICTTINSRQLSYKRVLTGLPVVQPLYTLIKYSCLYKIRLIWVHYATSWWKNLRRNWQFEHLGAFCLWNSKHMNAKWRTIIYQKTSWRINFHGGQWTLRVMAMISWSFRKFLPGHESIFKNKLVTNLWSASRRTY